MDVAFEVSVFVADDEGDFGVGFKAFDSVKNLSAGAAEFFGAVEIMDLIKAGFDFDEGGDLLS